MEGKAIIFGETGMEQLLQWLHATGQPQTVQVVLEQYLEILRELVREEQA